MSLSGVTPLSGRVRQARLQDNMGYDIVRLNEKGEPKQVTDLDDSDYFRLNIWGMSRARKIAAWGAGKMSNEEMMKEYSDGEPSSGGLQQMLAAAAAIMTSAGTEDLPWGNAFCHNGEEHDRETTEKFREGLQAGLDKLLMSPVRPDFDIDYLVEFSEYLRDSQHGVYVG